MHGQEDATRNQRDPAGRQNDDLEPILWLNPERDPSRYGP
jgi:hypothetical protein